MISWNVDVYRTMYNLKTNSKELVMKKVNYDKIMSYLNVIEAELNKVAVIVGRDDFNTFVAKKRQKELKKVA